jgi:plasmid stabilization system protein ParE
MQKLPYFFSPESLEDLQSLYFFLCKNNDEEIFDEIREKINIAIQLLREFPEIGVKKQSGVRTYPVLQTRYVIIFQVKNNELEIIRIFHTSQKWED